MKNYETKCCVLLCAHLAGRLTATQIVTALYIKCHDIT